MPSFWSLTGRELKSLMKVVELEIDISTIHLSRLESWTEVHLETGSRMEMYGSGQIAASG